jgi:predicted nucleotidyltransferase
MLDKYLPKIKEVIKAFDPSFQNRYFVFGSSLRKERFNDIDIGVIGAKMSGIKVSDLKEKIEDTTIPYFIDVVDFDSAQKSFSDYVFNNEPIVWIN